ncbi:MAG: hypothetical protein ACE5IT_03845 [bacterium]
MTEKEIVRELKELQQEENILKEVAGIAFRKEIHRWRKKYSTSKSYPNIWDF